MDQVKREIALIFEELAQGLETGEFGTKSTVAVMALG